MNRVTQLALTALVVGIVATIGFSSCQPTLAASPAPFTELNKNHVDALNRFLHPAAGVCVCGYQPNNHCQNGHVYQFSYCRDSNGQDCGTSDVDTGVTCP